MIRREESRVIPSADTIARRKRETKWVKSHNGTKTLIGWWARQDGWELGCKSLE